METKLYIIIATIILGTLYFLFFTKDKKEEKITEHEYNNIPSDLTVIEDEVLQLINNRRTKLGLNVLETDKLARTLAEVHCIEMYKQNEISHFEYPSRLEILKINGAKEVGEIISYGYTSSIGILNGFIKSENHDKIMTNYKYTHVGIRAIQEKESYKHYVTIIFIEI